jgi:hypothetical protein
MVDTVQTRPNHYELLGLTPGASDGEIARAFARELGRPRAFGGLAEVSVAYETLRNPSKRRAYDAAIGLRQDPTPTAAVKATWAESPYLLRASAHPAEPPAARPAVPTPARSEPEPKTEAGAAPFIAARLQELAAPEPLNRVERQAAPLPKLNLHPAFEPNQSKLQDSGEGMVQWRRLAIPAGVLLLAVGVGGAWTGWQSRGGGMPSERAAMLAPPPTTFTVSDPPAAVPVRVLDEAQPVQPKPSSRLAVRIKRRPATSSRLADLEKQLAEPSPADPVPAVLVADSVPDEATPAALPISSAVIARTIGRIGYPCGKVASSSQSDSAGVFTVTCTSGHSYRATPIRGRYHFRRL